MQSCGLWFCTMLLCQFLRSWGSAAYAKSDVRAVGIGSSFKKACCKRQFQEGDGEKPGTRHKKGACLVVVEVRSVTFQMAPCTLPCSDCLPFEVCALIIYAAARTRAGIFSFYSGLERIGVADPMGKPESESDGLVRSHGSDSESKRVLGCWKNHRSKRTPKAKKLVPNSWCSSTSNHALSLLEDGKFATSTCANWC
jgi:hypothetical protein